MLFFDHKLPDRFSTYTQIIAYSPLIPLRGYIFDEIELGNGFIVGCSRNINQLPSVVLNTELTANNEIPLCPHPIYKLLTYTYNTKQVDPKESLLEMLRINLHICGYCGSEAKFYSYDITFCGKSCQVSYYTYLNYDCF